jgi:DNA repair exonuclease SbcCD ATPase subunit
MAKKKINTENTIKAIYPSSLIAQNFAEGDDSFHGYVLWDISNNKNITHTKKEIKSDYSYKTLKVNRFTDFSDLDLEIENPTKFMNIRVIWSVFPSDYNNDNIYKVTKYLRNKYGNDIVLTHPKDFIVDDEIVVENKDDLKLENIASKDVQQKIFKTHLEENGYDESFIDEIIKLDDEISNRIQYNEVDNIIWKPIKILGENFRSYKDIEFDFRNYIGTTQIGGKNKGGKSSIIQLLMYTLYGKTIETEKIQKNGDNRFINNKLNTDQCSGYCVIEANGEFYGVYRQTNRKWNRTKTEISGTPTFVKYYKLSSPDDEISTDNEISEDNRNLSEEDRVKTQKVINKIIGDYDNFNRLVLTTADTLNKILAVNKADFIDNLLYDLGLDIFDKKLEEFKTYKSDYQKNNEKVIINIESSEERIKNYLHEITSINKEIDDITSIEMINLDNKLKIGEEFKENLIKKLHTIKPELEALNPDIINHNINKFKQDGLSKKEQYLTNQNKIKSLKVNYDKDKLDSAVKEKDDFKQKVYEQKDLINTKKDEIREVQDAKSKLQTEIFLIEKEIKSLKDENEKLEHSKTCPTCNQVLRPEDITVIKEKIITNNNSINEKQKRINQINERLPKADSKIKSINDEISTINTKINDINIEMEKTLQLIGELTNDKNEVEEREKLILRNESIKTEMENLKLKIDKENQLLDEYNKNLEQIDENKKTNDKIRQAQDRIREINQERELLFNKINSKNNDIYQRQHQINEITNNINKFKNQERVENKFKVYQSLIHRDGIPTKLLKQHSIPVINRTLSKLLENVSFNVWLDPEEITLKMADISKTDAIIDCISGSGMERTFSAITFKFCLNELNIKSRPSLIILDEVTGKLVDESVELFVELLSIIKKKIENILIIEHTHDVQPDYYVEVFKNEYGISELINK